MISRPVLWNAGRLSGRRDSRRRASTTARFLLSLCLRCAQRSAKDACRQVAHGHPLELSGGSPCAFLSTVSAIAEQSRHCFPSTKEVHLKSMRLFLGAWLGVDATDVLLRVGIRSFSHGRVPNKPL